MTAASFADADIQEVIDKLTTEETISLISGVGLWSTAAVPRLGIPSIKVTDGTESSPSSSIPTL
ncbi:glycoside hydrolase family 3 protein [Tulasnella calospora MUT 4182]|uniref:Glycoside hydrolase family 3 protein n=1 Tax=Tulasnella calospora MUT 4182 TaxID=1051891 RepID=A0A0C3L0L5_9AGAM|nr:glycoside hydrolase family 3 protein [Tulasnella calospora MUT 4182]